MTVYYDDNDNETTWYEGDDRVQQVNAIQQVASNLTSADMEWSSPEELADWWLSQAEELPKWWDDSDRVTLIDWIERYSK